jgi:hypothetical protein
VPRRMAGTSPAMTVRGAPPGQNAHCVPRIAPLSHKGHAPAIVLPPVGSYPRRHA